MPELVFGLRVLVVVPVPVPVFGLRGQEPERRDALAAPGPEFEPALAALKASGTPAGFA
jgi:hypothetical protein